MRGLPAWVVLALVVAVPCAGQERGSEEGRTDTTNRTITFPAPEEGIIYVRSGEPGGVRIYSRTGPSRRPAGVDDEERAAAGNRTAPEGDPAVERTDNASDLDLERLARVFDRQGVDLYAEMTDDRSGVVVLRDSVSGAPVDTLRIEEARGLVESFDVPAVELGNGGAAERASVERLVRRILDAGLVRSLQVHFEFDRSDLLPSSHSTLDALAAAMKSAPDLRLRIAGHTDAIGSEAYNRALSERRAESVKRYLEEHGIDPNRLVTTGHGEERPILSNDTPTGRAMNRRVEFIVLGESSVEIDPAD